MPPSRRRFASRVTTISLAALMAAAAACGSSGHAGDTGDAGPDGSLAAGEGGNDSASGDDEGAVAREGGEADDATIDVSGETGADGADGAGAPEASATDATLDATLDAIDAEGGGAAVEAGRDGSFADTGADGTSDAGADAQTDSSTAGPCLFEFGDSSRQWPGGVAADHDSNFVITGSFDGTIDFGGHSMTRTAGSGATDIYVAKFDSACRPVFSKQYGDGAEQYGRGVATDANGNVLLIGSFLGSVNFGGGALDAGWDDVYVAKLDSAGNHAWSHSYGASATKEEGYGIAVDGSGNASIAGEIIDNGTLTFGSDTLTGAGGFDIWAAKLDSSGNALWGKRFGDAADQRGGEVAVDAAGDTFLAGYFKGSIDFGGGALSYAVQGTLAGNDVYVAKLDTNGAYKWAHSYGDGNDQYGDAIAVDSNGDVLVTGHFVGSINFGLGALTATQGQTWIFVAKLSGSDGHAIWSESFWGGSYQIPTALTVDGSGNAYLAGSFQGALTFGTPLTQADGSQGVFVTKFDPSGNALWSAGGGQVTWQLPSGIAVDPVGRTLVTGGFEGALNLAGGSISAAGTEDIFLARLPAN